MELTITTFGYRWVITEDYIENGRAVGTEGPSSADSNMKDNAVHFGLYDDDRECYAEGILYRTDDAYDTYDPAEVDFSPLDNFGTPNWGCTRIKHNGEWL